MRRLAFATLLFLVAACGGEQMAADPASSKTRNIITEGIHDERVGQPGGFGCGEGPDAVCDVVFTVTAIEQDLMCRGVPPAGGDAIAAHRGRRPGALGVPVPATRAGPDAVALGSRDR